MAVAAGLGDFSAELVGDSSGQNPTISLADDVAATKRILAAQDGPAILVVVQVVRRPALRALDPHVVLDQPGSARRRIVSNSLDMHRFHSSGWFAE